MTDVQLQSALTRLAPKVDDAPAWDDVVERADTGPRVRWKLAVVAVAMLLTVGLVAGALAEGLLSGSLDRLSAWVGDQPGEPAPEQQAAFNEESAASFAHFPPDTRVGRLLRFEFSGRSHDLYGFRDGSNLCIRIVPSLFPGTASVPECVPRAELTRLGEPVAVLGSYVRMPAGDGLARTILYGVAADSIERVEARVRSRSLGSARVQNNAYFLVAPDEPRSPHDTPLDDPALVLRAHGGDTFTDVQVPTFSAFRRRESAVLPGPTRVERALDSGSIGWLERGEPRGEPFEWPYNSPDRILYTRMLTPDPASSFRLALAHGEDPDWRENGRWYCLAWLWPLVPGSRNSHGCGRDNLLASGLTLEGVSPVAGGFPHYVGLASDDVGRIEVFYEDRSIQRVPLRDNVFSFYGVAGQHSKLVAYDHEGRVVGIHVIS